MKERSLEPLEYKDHYIECDDRDDEGRPIRKRIVTHDEDGAELKTPKIYTILTGGNNA